jgi:replicative DNA helicase
LIIVAGRPGMGKTAIAVTAAMYPAIFRKKPTAIFSLEMSKEQLVSRMQSNLSNVDVSRIVKKQIAQFEIDKIRKECYQLEDAPIYIDDSPNISLVDLKSKSRKLVRDMNVELIVIDYLQLMRSGLNIFNREQEIAEISRGLKGLAKELKIPIIALSQLSRVVESRADKKPMLSDLRESGQIEQDADMVIFCYRPEYYAIETYEVDGEQFSSDGLFMCIVAKHRNGELGEIPLRFIGSQTKITNYQEEENQFSGLKKITQVITTDTPF